MDLASRGQLPEAGESPASLRLETNKYSLKLGRAKGT